MKVAELRQKLQGCSRDRLEGIILEMYKAMPKSVKEAKGIDLITNQCISKRTLCSISCIRCPKERTDQFRSSLHASHIVNDLLLHIVGT
ncbi:MAG: hypothetical protein LAP85_21095, partial [Acidobacteriia bacterium]|nr:hypothetical protein [Terriglobia bacterium]